jgi:hypothetical protein
LPHGTRGRERVVGVVGVVGGRSIAPAVLERNLDAELELSKFRWQLFVRIRGNTWYTLAHRNNG